MPLPELDCDERVMGRAGTGTTQEVTAVATLVSVPQKQLFGESSHQPIGRRKEIECSGEETN